MRALSFASLASSLLLACGGGTPPPASTAPPTSSARPAARVVSAGVMIEPRPNDEHGAPRIHTRVMLVGSDGNTVATLDLGEAVSHATCAGDEAPSLAEGALSMTFECGTVEHVDYRITLVDHRDHVAVWTFLADEGAGNWSRMGDLYVPRGSGVSLLSAPIPASPAAALAAP